MSIACLQRAVLVGDSAQLDAVLMALQELGVTHVIEQNKRAADDSCSSEQAQQALNYLRAVARQRRLQKPSGKYVLSDVVRDILDNQQQRKLLDDEIELKQQHIRALRPWGDFKLPDLEQMAGYRLWFYEVPLSKLRLLTESSFPWMAVSQDHRVHYVVVLAIEEPDSIAIPFARVHTGSDSLLVLEHELELVRNKQEDLNAERESLTRWILPLTEFITNCQDNEQKNWAQQQTTFHGPCFELQVWVPEDSVDSLHILTDHFSLALQLYQPVPNEEPPVLLQNPKYFAGAQDIVNFFQLPGYHSWDPSPVLFVFFTLFFAMILADAGYALVLGILLSLRWRRLGQTPVGQQRRTFFLVLVSVSMLFGVICGSYFGVTPEPTSPLGQLHLLDLNDFSVMMKLSVSIGVFHLLLANALQARTRPAGFQRMAPWGWNGLIAGGYGYWLSSQLPWLQMPAQWLEILGVVVILLCSGERILLHWRDLGWRLLDGAKALYGISKAFGDVLSYLRLFALGLSSASLAVTFNQLAADVRNATGPGGIVLCVLILVIGHALNLVLGVMSGVIHGLRLNLLEFYNWGIRGEGIPFNAFRKLGKD